MIKWDEITPDERGLIVKIVDRAIKEVYEPVGVKVDRLGLNMDITAAHISNPLKLEELLTTDIGNFGHDVTGIVRYINRDTGELEECFCPRYSK